MQWIHKVAQAELVPCQQLINLFVLSGENPPEDDLQSATVELSEVPVPVFHGPGVGTPLVGEPRPGHRQHAGRRQQGSGQWEVSCLWQGRLLVIKRFPFMLQSQI